MHLSGSLGNELPTPWPFESGGRSGVLTGHRRPARPAYARRIFWLARALEELFWQNNSTWRIHEGCKIGRGKKGSSAGRLRFIFLGPDHLVVMMFSRAQIPCCFLNLIRTHQRASAFAASTGAHRRSRRSRLHQKRHPKHSSGMSDRARRRRRYGFAQCPPAAAPTAAVLHHVPVLRGLAVDRGLF